MGKTLDPKVKKLTDNILEAPAFYDATLTSLSKIKEEYGKTMPADAFIILIGQLNSLIEDLTNLKAAFAGKFKIGKHSYSKAIFEGDYKKLSSNARSDLTELEFKKLKEIYHELDNSLLEATNKKESINRHSIRFASSGSGVPDTPRKRASARDSIAPMQGERRHHSSRAYSHESGEPNNITRHSDKHSEISVKRNRSSRSNSHRKPSSTTESNSMDRRSSDPTTSDDSSDTENNISIKRSSSHRSSEKRNKSDKKTNLPSTTDKSEKEASPPNPNPPIAPVWLSDAVLRFAVERYRSNLLLPCGQGVDGKLADLLLSNKPQADKLAMYHDILKTKPPMTFTPLTGIINQISLCEAANRNVVAHWLTPNVVALIVKDYKEYYQNPLRFFSGSKEAERLIKFLESAESIENKRAIVDYFQQTDHGAINKIIAKNKTMVEAKRKPIYGVSIGAH